MQIAHHLSELWKKKKKGVLFMKHRIFSSNKCMCNVYESQSDNHKN